MRKQNMGCKLVKGITEMVVMRKLDFFANIEVRYLNYRIQQ